MNRSQRTSVSPGVREDDWTADLSADWSDSQRHSTEHGRPLKEPWLNGNCGRNLLVLH